MRTASVHAGGSNIFIGASGARLAPHECVIGRLSSIVSIAGFSYVSVGVGGSIELPILFVSAVGGAQLTVDAASVIQGSQEFIRDSDSQFQGLEKSRDQDRFERRPELCE